MGNKTIVEWYYNDDDEKVKKTTKIKVSTLLPRNRGNVPLPRPREVGPGQALLLYKPTGL